MSDVSAFQTTGRRVVATASGRPFREHTFVTHGGSPPVTKLIGSRCTSCGAQAFPARISCARCRATAGLEEVELGPRGTLYTFALVRQAPKPFEPPYVIGYVDLDEGVRVFTQLTVADPADLRLGMAVEACVDRLYTGDDGTDVLTYKFRPVTEEGDADA